MIAQRFQHQRHTHRLETHDDTSDGAYFVTICTQARDTPWFGEVARNGIRLNAAGEMVKDELQRLETRFSNLELDAFVVMPDHIHAIAMLPNPDENARTKIRRGEPRVRPPTVRSSNETQPLPSPRVDNSRVAQGDPCDRPHERPDGTANGSVVRIVQAFKSITTHQHIRGVRTFGWSPFEKRFWRRDDWERVIRDDHELEVRRSNIVDHPARWLEKKR
jgi:putative transposase